MGLVVNWEKTQVMRMWRGGGRAVASSRDSCAVWLGSGVELGAVYAV